MIKLIALIALCTNYLAHADGYADLVAIQKNFPRLVSQTPVLGIAGSAPEVPYVAGSLGDPKPTGGENPESDALKEALYAMGQAQRAAEYKAINFSLLNTYNKYKDTGHSTFGIAAQERVDLSPAPLAAKRGGPPPPVAQECDAPPRDAMAGMLAGFGGFKKKTQPPEDGPAPTAVPAPAPVGKPILVRAQEKLAALRVLPASKDNAVDIAILEMLVAELTAPVIAGRSKEEITKLEELKEFFALLETPPTTTAGQTMVGRLRMRLKPKQVGAVAFAVPVVDPVEAAIEEAVNGKLLAGVPVKLSNNKKAIAKAIKRINSLATKTAEQAHNLKVLRYRHQQMGDDDSEDESDGEESSDGEDTPPLAAPFVRMVAPVFAPPPFSGKPVGSGFGGTPKPPAVPVAVLPPPLVVAQPQPLTIALPPPPGVVAAAQAPLPDVDIDTWAEQEFQREKQSIFDEIDRAQTEYASIPVMKRVATGGNIKKRIESLKTDLLKYEGFAADNTKKQIKTRYPRFR